MRLLKLLTLSAMVGGALFMSKASAKNIESGSWQLNPASDNASISIIEDPVDPLRETVIKVKHDRTRTSTLSLQLDVEPYSNYLLQWEIRSGRSYETMGSGIYVRAFSGNEAIGISKFYTEENLSEAWHKNYMTFSTGDKNKISLLFQLIKMHGEVFIDNFKFKKLPRNEVRRVIGSAGNGMSFPRIPVEPGKAEARLWYDEFPVSTRIGSNIVFQVQSKVPDANWAERKLSLVLPTEVEVWNPRKNPMTKIDPALVLSSVANKYILGAEYISKVGADWFCNLYIIQKSPLGSNKKAIFFIYWQGGQQHPVQTQIVELDIPVCKQPQNILCGIQSSTDMVRYYGNQFPGILKSLGINYLTYWKLGAGKEWLSLLRQNGIKTDTEHSGVGEYVKILKNHPECKATNHSGQIANIISPLPEGGILQQMLTDMNTLASYGFAGVAYDDEYYRDWQGMDIDMSLKAKRLWRQWLSLNYPSLSYVEPEAIWEQTASNQLLLGAWRLFRCSLRTEWYKQCINQFKSSSNEHTPVVFPWTALQAGRPTIKGSQTSLFNYRELKNHVDYFSPQFYCSPIKIRTMTRKLTKVVGKEKALPLLVAGEARANRFVWKKGELKAMILEVLFAGAAGYNFWGIPYTNLTRLAEIAETNNAVAQHESVFVNGTETNSFEVEEEPRQFVSVLETPREGLLLVSNYTKIEGKNNVLVIKNVSAAFTLTNVFTGEVIELVQGQTLFYVNIEPGQCVLFHWSK